jgi:hypothetical protein
MRLKSKSHNEQSEIRRQRAVGRSSRLKYDFKAVESKWQAIWDEKKAFAACEDYSRPKFYGLVEFPYPSGQGCMSATRGRTRRWILCAENAGSRGTMCCIPWDGMPSDFPPKIMP